MRGYHSRFWLILAVLLGLFLLGRRYFLLTASPFLHGADAYYYALQVRSLVETGTLRMADAAPLLPLMAWTAKLGLGYEKAVILWALLAQLCAASSLLGASLILHGRKDGLLTGFLLFAWAALSPVLTFTAIEFPKYALALAFLPLWPVGLLKPRWLPLSLAAVLFSCANHRALVGLAGLAGVGLVIAAVAAYRPKPRLVILGASVLAALALIALTFGRRYFSLADLGRIDLRGLRPGIWTFLARPAIPPALKLEAAAALAGGGFLWLSAGGPVWPALFRRAWGGLLLLALIPLGSAEVMGLAERLVLALPVFALSLAALPRERLEDAGKRQPCPLSRIAAPALLIVLVLAGLFPGAHLRLAHPDRLDPDYALYERVTRELIQCEIPMLIAHQGLNLYYKYRTLRDSFPYEPEAHWPKSRIWRAAHGVAPAEWAYYLPGEVLWDSGLLADLPGLYDLVREDVWDGFRRRVAEADDEELKARILESWLNPNRPRPGFLEKPDDSGEFSARP